MGQTPSEQHNDDTMKIIIFSCLLAVAFAQEARPIPVAILRQEYTPSEGGSFNHVFESEDGTSVSATGSVGNAGQVNIQGSYTFPLPHRRSILTHHMLPNSTALLMNREHRASSST